MTQPIWHFIVIIMAFCLPEKAYLALAGLLKPTLSLTKLKNNNFFSFHKRHKVFNIKCLNLFNMSSFFSGHPFQIISATRSNSLGYMEGKTH
jgi:hypothetical protein